MARLSGHVRALAVLVALAVASAGAHAQQLTRDTQLAAADLRTDLALLQRAYTALHPGLYRYQSEAEVAAGLAAVEQDVNAPLGQ